MGAEFRSQNSEFRILQTDVEEELPEAKAL